MFHGGPHSIAPTRTTSGPLPHMLDELPVEILQQIVDYLPSVSSITNLFRVNKALRTKLATDENGIFRRFVQTSFPLVIPPPLWREASCALTSRTRAWDRRSLIARHVLPPKSEDLTWGLNTPYVASNAPFTGPRIDTYGHWTGPRWSDEDEVLAWSVFGRLCIRVKQKNSKELWASAGGHADADPYQDIQSLRLLRPHQNDHSDQDTILISNMGAAIYWMNHSRDTNVIDCLGSFRLSDPTARGSQFDITSTRNPLLASVRPEAIDLFRVDNAPWPVFPHTTLALSQSSRTAHPISTLKFISESTLAIAFQSFSKETSSISLFDPIHPMIVDKKAVASREFAPETSRRGVFPRSLAALPSAPDLRTDRNTTIISGWSDGVVRLFDSRDPKHRPRQIFTDGVDDGQIMSVLPLAGTARFLAGSHQNGCLKVFDLRMPGNGRVYSYLDLKHSSAKQERRGSSFLLSFTHPHHRLPDTPFHHDEHSHTRPSRYKGAIFALSQPSTHSPRVFAGIELGVISLDAHDTNDIFSNVDPSLPPSSLSSNPSTIATPESQHRRFKDIIPSPTDFGLSKPSNKPPTTLTTTSTKSAAAADDDDDPSKFPLRLSAYLRPRPSHIQTDPVLLRKQLDWRSTVARWTGGGGPVAPEKMQQQQQRGNAETRPGQEEHGEWDGRWRLVSEEGPSWRRQGPPLLEGGEDEQGPPARNLPTRNRGIRRRGRGARGNA